MSGDCELLPGCGFFKKYETSRSFACRGFLRQYCQGPDADSCKRRAFRLEHGVAPSPDMMPNGMMMAGSSSVG